MPSIKINGKSHPLHSPPNTPLLWALRDELGLKGTKYGCGVGVCGLCMVHIDGKAVRSCVISVKEALGKQVTTIEGLGSNHPLIRAWIEEQVPQCGYCQPGQIMTAAALLKRTPQPEERSVDATMSAVLCRCGSYPRIRRAMRRANERHEYGDSEDRMDSTSLSTNRTSDKRPPFSPNPWVRIYRDGTVVIVIDRSEMGQGVVTGLAMLAAEELEVDLSQVQTVFAPADDAYSNPLIGEQLTGGSTSIRGGWKTLRRAGAQARETLIEAAALIWDVSSRDCRADKGAVVHAASGRRLEYGALVDMARNVRVPEEVTLKEPAQFRVIGRSTPRLEIPDMVCGKTVYGIDFSLPGMLVASIERCPYVGGKLVDYDVQNTLAVAGVRDVLAIPSGIAVVAENAHAAFKGRQALETKWLPGAGRELDSASIRRAFVQAAGVRGKVALKQGNVKRALKNASRVLECVYETPYLAHGCLEPMNCCADVTARGCEIWTGTQAQTAARHKAAETLGMDPTQVKVHTQFIGGGFGRRGDNDFIEDTVRLAQAVKTPVQVIWSRQDDIRHDRFRPASHTLMRAGLDENGLPTAWFQHIIGPQLVFNGIHLPYTIPNVHEEHSEVDPGVPTGAWRAVGASQNAFAIEGFVDELAHVAGEDPFEYRYKLLADNPSFRTVLEVAADRGGWQRPTPEGHGCGIAFYYSFRTAVAQLIEVSVSSSSEMRVHRVVCAVDCGLAVNPDAVIAQLEGGIIFGLSAALKGEITLEEGRVQQSSFEDYPILTFAETPQIDIHILPSTARPRGVGEPGVPPVAPALANAVFAATGRRLRSLPLRLNSSVRP